MKTYLLPALALGATVVLWPGSVEASWRDGRQTGYKVEMSPVINVQQGWGNAFTNQRFNAGNDINYGPSPNTGYKTTTADYQSPTYTKQRQMGSKTSYQQPRRKSYSYTPPTRMTGHKSYNNDDCCCDTKRNYGKSFSDKKSYSYEAFDSYRSSSRSSRGW